MMNDKSIKIIDSFFLKYPDLIVCKKSILDIIDLLILTFKNGNKLLVAGNGGSASDCDHIVGELMKGFKLKRGLSSELVAKISDDEISSMLQYGLPVISLSAHTSLLTAIINDQSSNVVFAQQVLSLGKKDDVLFLISTSGNSKNCYYALKVAKALGLKVVSLTGKSISLLSQNSNIVIQVPADETYLVQEYHLPVYHLICSIIENEIFGE